MIIKQKDGRITANINGHARRVHGIVLYSSKHNRVKLVRIASLPEDFSMTVENCPNKECVFDKGHGTVSPLDGVSGHYYVEIDYSKIGGTNPPELQIYLDVDQVVNGKHEVEFDFIDLYEKDKDCYAEAKFCQQETHWMIAEGYQIQSDMYEADCCESLEKDIAGMVNGHARFFRLDFQKLRAKVDELETKYNEYWDKRDKFNVVEYVKTADEFKDLWKALDENR